MFLIALLSIAIHSCYIGSKVVVSLLALELGASHAVRLRVAAARRAVHVTLHHVTPYLARRSEVPEPIAPEALQSACRLDTPPCR
jgi:hypothetical protein